MLKTTRTSILLVLFLTLIISGCASASRPAVAPDTTKPQIGTQPAIVVLGTQNVDPCSSTELKKPEVEKLARIMGEFDDASALVTRVTNSDNLVNVILELQRIRWVAINNNPPTCLKTLRDSQINFMSGVVRTSLNIQSKVKMEDIQRNLAETRKLREVFDMELANQLGMKYVTVTPAPTIPMPPTSTVAPVTATTDQDKDIYVLQGPGMNFSAIGTFLKGQVTNVIGRNEAGDWIQIDVPSAPGNAGWVPKQLIKLQGDVATIPLAAIPPTPQPTAAQ
jgi:hypothetical protein